MIRKDKDRHTESTKQKAAFVFPSEETPSCLWSELLLKLEIAARVHHSPPERPYLSLRTNTSSNLLLCVPGSTHRHSNKQINTHACSRKISCGNLVLLLSWRNEELVSRWPESSDASLVWIRSVCTNTWKGAHCSELYATWWLHLSRCSSYIDSFWWQLGDVFCNCVFLPFQKAIYFAEAIAIFFISVQDLGEQMWCHHLVFSIELQQKRWENDPRRIMCHLLSFLKQNC